MQVYRDSQSAERNPDSQQFGYNLMDFAIRRRAYVLSQFP
jgi:hypothetical protein